MLGLKLFIIKVYTRDIMGENYKEFEVNNCEVILIKKWKLSKRKY